MNRTEMEQALWRTRSDQARAEYLSKYIPLMEKRLAQMKEEALQGLGRGVCWEMPPRGGSPGDPTAQMALKAADYTMTEEMRMCRDRLRVLKKEAAALEAKLSMTQWLLETLTEESRFLLTERLIRHTRWQELPERYQERFGEYYAVLTLRRRVAQALDTLCCMSEEAI